MFHFQSDDINFRILKQTSAKKNAPYNYQLFGEYRVRFANKEIHQEKLIAGYLGTCFRISSHLLDSYSRISLFRTIKQSSYKASN